MLELGVKILIAYLLGTLLGSLILGRMRGVDIRSMGSGNAGATNALRTQGKLFGFLVLLIDIAKGVIAVWWLPSAALPGIDIDAGVSREWLTMACGFAVIVGHVYPVWFDFRGGKGAATVVGVVAALELRLLVPLLVSWIIVLLLSGYVGLATMLSTVALAAAVLVLEPALGLDGRAKTRRKGIGEIEIIVHGRAAHAGVDPERGVNAAHELALQIARLMKMNDPRRGITLQANVISGGTASNVVPEFARALVDVRFAWARDAWGLERRLLRLRPILKGARIEVRGGLNRPPLERTAGVANLFRHAQSIAREIGFELNEASTGGASDGNFTGALGVPTLDGIGAVGDGAHSLREHVVIRELPRRGALLAGLLASL